jgi:uncharacterized caspase-like protein
MAKIAVIIGVSDYPQKMPEAQRLKLLPKAIEDAKAIADVMRAMGRFDVKLLINPTKSEMEVAINAAFASTRAKDDLILMYFSGHGIKDFSGHFYLCSTETYKQSDGNLLKASSLAATTCHDLMRDCLARRKVVILDSCLSAAFAEGMPSKTSSTIDLKTALGGEGVVLISSSDSTELSYERLNGEFSVYTNYLLEGMRSGLADINNDGWVDVQEAHTYANERTRKEVPSMHPRIFVGIKDDPIRLLQVPHNLKLQRYKHEVERQVQSNGELGFIGREILSFKQSALRLSKAEAQTIELQVQKPLQHHHKNLQKYNKALEYAWRDGKPEKTEQDQLDILQKTLGLQDEELTPLLDKHHAILEAQNQCKSEKKPLKKDTRDQPFGSIFEWFGKNKFYEEKDIKITISSFPRWRIEIDIEDILYPVDYAGIFYKGRILKEHMTSGKLKEYGVSYYECVIKDNKFIGEASTDMVGHIEKEFVILCNLANKSKSTHDYRYLESFNFPITQTNKQVNVLLEELKESTDNKEKESIAIELAYTSSNNSISELINMVEGKRKKYMEFYDFDDQLIGIKALGETGNIDALEYLITLLECKCTFKKFNKETEFGITTYNFPNAKKILKNKMSYTHQYDQEYEGLDAPYRSSMTSLMFPWEKQKLYMRNRIFLSIYISINKLQYRITGKCQNWKL